MELLNSTAPSFFATVQDALIDSIVLCACRLTDPAENRGGRDENLSIKRLVDSVSENVDDQYVVNELQNQESKINQLASPLRSVRNKMLAHNDLPVLVGNEPLPSVDRQEVEELLSQLRNLMNDISEMYSVPKVSYNEKTSHGAQLIIAYLKIGLSRKRKLSDSLEDTEL